MTVIMRLGVLFSGGKDSTLAILKTKQHEEVACLITILSSNAASYMFHTPNISLTRLQAEAMDIPLVQQHTRGKKGKELADLKKAIIKAKEGMRIEGVVTGAVDSVYQAERVQKICNKLDLWCFNPLWKMDQRKLLEEVVSNDFEVIISGVFAYPLDELWLGKTIDKETIGRLLKLKEDFGISPSGEGGEIETTVLDAPFFKSKVHIIDSSVTYNSNSGVFAIKAAELACKQYSSLT
jgi:diphthine-ammonia ligase